MTETTETVAAPTTDVAVQQPDEVDYHDLSEMGRWAHDAHQVSLMAARLVQTEFVPAAYKGKPAEATAAILTGLEVGLQPMAALRSIVSVNGTPAMVAVALRGLVQSKGHTIRLVEADETHAIVEGWRKGETESDAQRSVWTIERAAKLGLTGKKNWREQPQNMLIARATSEIARLVGSDVIMGVAYSLEELQDQDPPAERERPVAVPTARAEADAISARPVGDVEAPENGPDAASASAVDSDPEEQRRLAEEAFADMKPEAQE